MILGLCLVGVIAMIGTFAATTEKPARVRSRELPTWPVCASESSVRIGPGRTTEAEPEMPLPVQELEPSVALWVIDEVRRRELSPPVMWRWADRFGTERLVLALDAEVPQASLLRHLEAHTVPDWSELELFARLNSSSSAFAASRHEVAGKVLADFDPVDLDQFHDLPPIAPPGLSSKYEKGRPASPHRGNE